MFIAIVHNRRASVAWLQGVMINAWEFAKYSDCSVLWFVNYWLHRASTAFRVKNCGLHRRAWKVNLEAELTFMHKLFWFNRYGLLNRQVCCKAWMQEQTRLVMAGVIHSLGISAKYLTYSIMDTSSDKIIHFFRACPFFKMKLQPLFSIAKKVCKYNKATTSISLRMISRAAMQWKSLTELKACEDCTKMGSKWPSWHPIGMPA